MSWVSAPEGQHLYAEVVHFQKKLIFFLSIKSFHTLAILMRTVRKKKKKRLLLVTLQGILRLFVYVSNNGHVCLDFSDGQPLMPVSHWRHFHHWWDSSQCPSAVSNVTNWFLCLPNTPKLSRTPRLFIYFHEKQQMHTFKRPNPPKFDFFAL